jgi:hypothetical protein
MPSPNRFASSIARLEGLPSDGGKTVDTLAGGLLRTFVRIGELEAALARVSHRLAVLEGSGDPEPIVDHKNGAMARD